MPDQPEQYEDDIEAKARDTLAYLDEHPKQRKLIHDQVEDRWFVYAFDPDTTEVTSVPDDVADCLVGCAWVEERGTEARVDLKGPYGVYVITSKGSDAAEPAGS